MDGACRCSHRWSVAALLLVLLIVGAHIISVPDLLGGVARAQQPPPPDAQSALKDLGSIDDDMNALIDVVQAGHIGGLDTEESVRDIEQAKHDFINKDIRPFGLPGGQVFDALNEIDADLHRARVENEVQHSQFSTSGEKKAAKAAVLRALRAARNKKRGLEDAIRSSQPPPAGCAGHAMLGNIYGGQAHELVSDFTCQKASTEFSLTVPVGYQITGGQASNTASAAGYSCNLNATNTTVDCTGTAPGGSTTYVQMTTSPNPQAGMNLQFKTSFSDGTAANFTIATK